MGSSLIPTSLSLTRHVQPPSLCDQYRWAAVSRAAAVCDYFVLFLIGTTLLASLVFLRPAHGATTFFVFTIHRHFGSWPILLHSEYEAPDSFPRQQPLDAITVLIHSGKVLLIWARPPFLPPLQQELRLH